MDLPWRTRMSACPLEFCPSKVWRAWLLTLKWSRPDGVAKTTSGGSFCLSSLVNTDSAKRLSSESVDETASETTSVTEGSEGSEGSATLGGAGADGTGGAAVAGGGA